MLDINLFREEKGHNPEIIRESQHKRFKRVEIVDEIIQLDKDWRQRQFELEQLRKVSNKLNKEVAKLKISGADASSMIRTAEENKDSIAKKDTEVQDAWKELYEKLEKVGNLVHDSVPVSNTEKNNVVVRTHGKKTEEPNLLNHVELVKKLGIVDLDSGAKVAGNRGYFLKGDGVRLNQALINFGLDFLRKKKYTAVQTPFFMEKDIMGKCAQLSQFDDELYKVIGERDGKVKGKGKGKGDGKVTGEGDGKVTGEGDDKVKGGGDDKVTGEGDRKITGQGDGKVKGGGGDKYLIATAEQPLCAFHEDEWIQPSQLPIRYAGYSTCFRKEVGSHGQDTLGLFRVHQFEKIEQFCITSPEDSWKMHEEMIKNAEEFYEELELPYRIVNIVSGALNDAAAKKYDLEAWFPASGEYRELVSCSNCTDYQARKLKIRYGQKKGNDQTKQYCHLLNSTLTATQRTLCCILENYQTKDGVEIPKVLQKYMDGDTFITFPGSNQKRLSKVYSWFASHEFHFSMAGAFFLGLFISNFFFLNDINISLKNG